MSQQTSALTNFLSRNFYTAIRESPEGPGIGIGERPRSEKICRRILSRKKWTFFQSFAESLALPCVALGLGPDRGREKKLMFH
jgi:hypothetical protein